MRLPSTGKDGTNARLSSGSIGTVKRYESFVAHTRKHRDEDGHGGRLKSEELKGRSSSGSGSGSDSGSRDDEESATEEIIEKETGETDADETMLSPSIGTGNNKKKTLSLVEQRAAMFMEMEQKQFALPEIEVKGKRIESASVKEDAGDATNQNTEGAAPAESSAAKEKNNWKVTSRWVVQRAAIFDGTIQKKDDSSMQQSDEVEKSLEGTIGSLVECAGDGDAENNIGLKIREHDGTNEVENNEDECKYKASSSSTKMISTPSPSHMDFQSKKNALINFASGGRTATNYGRNEVYEPNKSRVATQHGIHSDEVPTANGESARTSTTTQRESSDSSAPIRSPSPSRLDFASKKKTFLEFATSQQYGAYEWRKGASRHHNDTITSFAGRNADRNGPCPDDDGPSLSSSPKRSFNPPVDQHIDEERNDDESPSTEDDCGQPIPSNNDTESQNIIISIESIAEVSEEELETPEPSPTMAGFHSANIDFESPLLKPSDMHLGRLRKPDSWKSPMGDETEERSPRGTDHPPTVSASTPSSYLERRSSRPSMESEQTKSSDGDSLDHIIFPTSRNGSDFAAAGRKHYDGIQCDQDVRQFSSDFDLPWCDKDPTAIIDHGTDDNNDIDDDDNKTASIAQLDSQAFEAEAIEFGMDLNAFQREIDLINAMTSPGKSTVTTPSVAAWSVGMHSFREDQGGNHADCNVEDTEIHDGDMTNYHLTVATPRSPMAQSPFASPRYGMGSVAVVDQDVDATKFSDGLMDAAEVDATVHQAETKNEDEKNRFKMHRDEGNGCDRDVEAEMHVGGEYPSKLQLFQESLSPKQRHVFNSIMEKRDLELKLLESQNRSKTVEVDLLKVELIDQHKQIQELLDQLTKLRHAANNDHKDDDAAAGGCDHDDEDDCCKENAPSKGNLSMDRELIDLRAKLQASEAAVAQLRMQSNGEDRRDSTSKNGGSAKKGGGKKAKNNRSLKARVFGKQLYHA